MVQDVEKMEQALANIQSLADEVAAGFFIPKKYRKALFTPRLRDGYVKYLRDEARDLKARIVLSRARLNQEPKLN